LLRWYFSGAFFLQFFIDGIMTIRIKCGSVRSVWDQKKPKPDTFWNSAIFIITKVKIKEWNKCSENKTRTFGNMTLKSEGAVKEPLKYEY